MYDQCILRVVERLALNIQIESTLSTVAAVICKSHLHFLENARRTDEAEQDLSSRVNYVVIVFESDEYENIN